MYEIRGIGCRFFTVAESSAAYSTHNCRPLCFLNEVDIGAAANDDNHWLKLFDRFASRYDFRVRCSTSDMFWISLYGILNPGSRSIA